MTDDRIHQYFARTAAPASAEYLDQFAPDAIVEDEGTEHHGTSAITEWARTVPAVTYDVRSTTNTDADVLISGDFAGSPVALRFHLEFDDDGRIAVLRIRG